MNPEEAWGAKKPTESKTNRAKQKLGKDDAVTGPDKHLSPTAGSDKLLEDKDSTNAPPITASMPLWSRATYAQHVNVREHKLKKGYAKPAGFPDFLWTRSPRGGDYGGVAEVKCFWSVTDKVLNELFTSTFAPNGEYRWNNESHLGTVIRQVGLCIIYSASGGYPH